MRETSRWGEKSYFYSLYQGTWKLLSDMLLSYPAACTQASAVFWNARGAPEQEWGSTIEEAGFLGRPAAYPACCVGLGTLPHGTLEVHTVKWAVIVNNLLYPSKVCCGVSALKKHGNKIF